MKDTIRLVKLSDSEAILGIYAPYIQNTAISFEQTVPSLDEFTKRIEVISAIYPYLVYETNGRVVGYAYAYQHGSRYAYRFSVDLSIYISEAYQGTGIAKKLYDGLFEMLRNCGYVNAYAGYTNPNDKSRMFHEKYGFTHVGTYHKVGYKFGKWHDVIWVEKTIQSHTDHPEETISIKDFIKAHHSSL
ncbi:MAG: GNAT family N-acetyltransferase [Lachnospiraceae bacterium]|jgi:phosphinothricin acetyltransferase|nr:GNAT family N-acetyltransferase [Lachnospiraceae bacterium]